MTESAAEGNGKRRGAERTARRRLRGLIPDEEPIVLAVKPHPLFAVLTLAGPLAGMGVAAGVAGWGATIGWSPTIAAIGTAVLALLGAAALAALAWQILEWRVRLYVLTDRRVLWVSGVLRRLVVEAPLRAVQHVVLYQSLRERVFGLGTLGFATAGTDGVEVVWGMVERPGGLLGVARATIEGDPPRRTDYEPLRASRATDAPPAAGLPRARETDRDVPVIGLVGGIGAGKSELASAFERLGCIVVDSDREARAALDRPEVRDELVAWWGSDVLTQGGGIDRRKVSEIVFGDERERRRLEGLIHPLVRAARHGVLERARRAAPAKGGAIVIDAPLLFEAGVDRECDAVVFVDAPKPVREARVASRGWDAQELARREAAQMPLEEKRRRADYVVLNDGTADLENQAAGVLRSVAGAGIGRGRAGPLPRASGGGGTGGPGEE